MTALLVPMRVEALHITAKSEDADRLVVRPTANFQSKNGQHSLRADEILVGGVPFSEPVRLPDGVHLHWALPAGMTHGVVEGSSGRPRFPSVPNRWLVSRIRSRKDVKCWIVESDRLSQDPPDGEVKGEVSQVFASCAAPTVPAKPEDRAKSRRQIDVAPSYYYLGRAFHLEGWKESAAVRRLEPFTALGWGDPSFAGIYSDCRTAFGFWDAEATEVCDVVYHVAGWYSDADIDPIQELLDHSAGTNRFRWTWRREPGSDSSGLRNMTVLTGFVELSTKRAIDEKAKAGGDSPLLVAIGPSGPLALAALLASQMGDLTREPALNAVQYGLFKRAGNEVGSVENFEAAVHEAGFSVLDGGVCWQLKAMNDPGQQGLDPRESRPLPEALSDSLQVLNRVQSSIDSSKRKLSSLRWELFANWWKYLTASSDGTGEFSSRLGIGKVKLDVFAHFKKLLAAITKLRDSINEQETKALKTAQEEVSKMVDCGWQLEPTVADRFYRPNDPVVVLQGSDVRHKLQEGNLSAGGLLRCRLEGNILRTVRPKSVDHELRELDADAVAPTWPNASPELPKSVISAFRETFFLAPILQAGNAALAVGSRASADFASGITQLLRGAATAILENRADGWVRSLFDGKELPEPLIGNLDVGAWRPLRLDFGVTFQPFSAVSWPLEAGGGPGSPPEDLAPDELSRYFDFSDESLDFCFKGQDDVFSSHLVSIVGSALLSPHAPASLIQAIHEAGEAAPALRTNAQAVKKKIKDVPRLAQALVSTMDAMLMQRSIIRLPGVPITPRGPLGLRTAVFNSLQNCITDAVGAHTPTPRLSMLPRDVDCPHFVPLCGGPLRLTRLRLVDQFGRVKNYSNPDVLVARGYAPPATLPSASNTAFLPPRFSQPARLRTEWISSGLRSEGHPAESPIFGWVLVSSLDESLFVFDVAGAPIAQLMCAVGGSSVRCLAPPGGSAVPWSRPPPDTESEIGRFVEAFCSLERFDALMALLRKTLVTSLPGRATQDVVPAMLSGRPLALVRVGISLELYGPAAVDQSWAAFAWALKWKNLGKVNSFGIDKVRIPIAVGVESNGEDSLVAWWVGRSERRYEKLLVPGRPDASVQAFVTAETPPRPLEVTLLMEPHGFSTVECGILPVKRLSLTPVWYGDALARLSVSFFAGPLLSGSRSPNKMLVPHPTENGGPWEWIEATSDGWRVDAIGSPEAVGEDYSPQWIADGWIRVVRPDPPK